MDRSRSCLAHFNMLPVARFTATPNPFSLPFDLDIRFDAGASTDSDGEIVLYQWDFGNDGSFDASGPEARCAPTVPGVLPVLLRVTDEQGGSGDVIEMIVVADRPIARIIAFPASPRVGEQVTFEAEQRDELVLYQWDFEADGVVDATGPVVTHTFTTSGTSRVRLRVRDSDDLSGSSDVEVDVLPSGGGNVTLTVVPAGAGRYSTPTNRSSVPFPERCRTRIRARSRFPMGRPCVCVRSREGAARCSATGASRTATQNRQATPTSIVW